MTKNALRTPTLLELCRTCCGFPVFHCGLAAGWTGVGEFTFRPENWSTVTPVPVHNVLNELALFLVGERNRVFRSPVDKDKNHFKFYKTVKY